MRFCRFFKFFVGILIIFLGLNAIIWFGWTREITDPYRKAGDLLRIGYILGYVSPRQDGVDLPRRHITINQYHGQPVDLVTIGDSFSLGGGGGRNCYYQDYIATLQHLSVLNIPADILPGGDAESAPMTILSKVINSGYLDIIRPRYLLLESVERLAINRCTKYFPLTATASVDELNQYFKSWLPVEQRLKPDHLRSYGFINNGNWKFIGNNLQYLIRDIPHDSMVGISQLDRRMFSSAHGDRLIFYLDDIKNSRLATPATVAALNRNLNQLAATLKAKGITLIFMPVVDKFDLYQPYLYNQSYPRSIFFEELRKLPKKYQFIDTKTILTAALKRGELDIFYQDDTHWNWKASQAIFSAVHIPAHDH